MFKTLKPPLGVRLNTGHPLANGLVGCWLMNEGGGDRIFDLSGNGRSGIGDSAPIWVPGGCNITAASTQRFDCGLINMTGWTELTCVFSCMCTDRSVDRGVFGNHEYDKEGLYVEYESISTRLYTYVKDTTTLAGRILSVTSNIPYVFGVVWKNGNLDLYKDGTLSTHITGGDGIMNPNPSPSSFYIGYNTRNDEYFEGDIYCVYLYNRGLTAAEIASLYANPYQMFEPEVLWKYVAYGAAAGGLSIPIAMHHYTKNIRSG